jgi:hypothetical protein
LLNDKVFELAVIVEIETYKNWCLQEFSPTCKKRLRSTQGGACKGFVQPHKSPNVTRDVTTQVDESLWWVRSFAEGELIVRRSNGLIPPWNRLIHFCRH